MGDEKKTGVLPSGNQPGEATPSEYDDKETGIGPEAPEEALQRVRRYYLTVAVTTQVLSTVIAGLEAWAATKR